MNTQEAYDFVALHIDLDNWIDYWIVITFFGNTDTGNIRFYRPHEEGGRWRWQLWDQDLAFVRATHMFNPFDNMLHPIGHGYRNGFCTLIARALMQNDTIRDRFIERYAELMETVLHPDRLIAIMDEYAALIAPEMPGQIERWDGPPSMAWWEASLASMRDIMLGRPAQIRRNLQETFNLSPARMQELFG